MKISFINEGTGGSMSDFAVGITDVNMGWIAGDAKEAVERDLVGVIEGAAEGCMLG